MGTIADKLERVLKTKKDIQSALVKNGKYVPDKLPFKYYPYLIDNMNIDGLVGMYYGKGLTNEELSKDPTWYDTSGNGNDLKFKNLACKLNSGAGLYLWDFNSWATLGNAYLSKNSSKVTLSGSPSYVPSGWGIAVYKNVGVENKIKATVEITGLTPELPKMYFGKLDESDISKLQELKNGINAIDITIRSEWGVYAFGFREAVDNCNVTIEQIPDYAGAVCLDGIDDCAFGNFPTLTKEKGYTVMALRKWLTPDNKKSNEIIVSHLNNEKWGSSSFRSFCCEIKYNNETPKRNAALSFGKESDIVVNDNDLLFYQTSSSYNGQNIVKGSTSTVDDNILFVGSGSIDSFFSNAAVYALCIIDHDTSDAERQIVINKWKQYYPELFPDQAWTVTGKTNEDEDRATVKNLTGNGNDLMLSNFAFAGDSGYGLYGTSFVNSFWIKDLNLLNTNSFHFTIPLGINSSSILHTDIRGKTSNIPPFKINVSGLGNIQFYYYYVSSDNTRYGFRLKDGVNNLPESYIANLDMDG